MTNPNQGVERARMMKVDKTVEKPEKSIKSLNLELWG